jgi:hypothetical protein
MIRVGEGNSFKHVLGPFHATQTVSSGFYVPVTTAAPPPPKIEGVVGTAVADPQPSPYPNETTFFIRGYSPLVQGQSVGTTYLTIDVSAAQQFSVTFNSGYTGVVRKVWDVQKEEIFERQLTGIYPLRFFLRHKDSGNVLKAFLDPLNQDPSNLGWGIILLPSSANPLANTTFPAVKCHVLKVYYDPTFASLKLDLSLQESYVCTTGAAFSSAPAVNYLTCTYVFPSN